ncbi:hypothetical protein C8R46DRAFT_1193924 [Mycena filopes]|nr:hypothetical protein C8R46DRAFT_1193924 [Mycena filopes]
MSSTPLTQVAIDIQFAHNAFSQVNAKSEVIPPSEQERFRQSYERLLTDGVEISLAQDVIIHCIVRLANACAFERKAMILYEKVNESGTKAHEDEETIVPA